MAASGSTIVNATFTTSGVVCDVLEFSWWENSQSVADNTTNVGWKMELISYKYGYIQSTASKSWSVNVNGTKHSGTNTVGINANSRKTLASGSTTIAHNDDGKKTFTYSFSQYFGIDFNGTVGTKSGSGSGTLTTIARASQPSLINKYPNTVQNVGDFGKTITIHMNSKSDVFTHNVSYAFGDVSETIAEGVKDSTPWTIPTSLMNRIPNGTSGSGTVYVDTYNGSTKVGTKWTGFTATVPSTVKPSCTCTLEDITGFDVTYGSPVQGLSKIKVTVNAKTEYSSSIKSYSISIDGVKYSTSEATTGFLVKSGKSTVTATVIDGRNRISEEWAYTMNVQEYSKPSIDKLTVHRCDSDGTENDQGEYIKATFSAKVTSLNSKNTANYVLKYKKASDTAYTEIALTDLGNKNFAPTNYSKVFAADGNSSYDVVLTATDNHGSATRSTSASTAFTLYNCHPSGTGWRFGGVAEEENTLQNDLWLVQRANRYCFSSIGAATTDGFILMARIEITATNSDSPITFVFSRRQAKAPMTVYVCFEETADLVPGLRSISYEGENYGAFLVQSADSVWDLYVQKVNQSDTVTLNDWFTSYRQMKRMTVTFPGTIVEGNEPNVLGTYHRATPAKHQSLLDYIFPVNSVYISYSHVSPASLFGGTWTRLENRFLWATSAGGTIGQTGGESTHTLTINEMPSHNHDFNSNVNWDATNGSYAHFRTGSNGNNYGKNNLNTASAGGGQAHNNMPPYIQVSIWRRTA